METKYYSDEQLQFVASHFDYEIDELMEIIEMDFLNEELELPPVDELVHHIEYQNSLIEMCKHADNDHDFAIAWSEQYA